MSEDFDSAVEYETVTRWITAVDGGDDAAAERLWPDLYEQLRRMARNRMGGLNAGDTLQPTALVHEAFARLAPVGGAPKGRAWENRHHLIFAAARAMHDVLVERARAKATLKRGGGRRRLDLDAVQIPHETPPEEMLALDEALAMLEESEPRRHRIVMLRFFAGLDAEATADVLGVSLRTVEREWRLARIALHAALRSTPSSPEISSKTPPGTSPENR